MATFNIVMPKLGESVQEATITKWFKKKGDSIKEEDILLEIATDKVDSEIPSPVDGILSDILYEENARVPVGTVIAVVDLASDDAVPEKPEKQDTDVKTEVKIEKKTLDTKAEKPPVKDYSGSGRFYSPLVKNIARSEGVSVAELENIEGTGHNGRVTKKDIQQYLGNRGNIPERPTLSAPASKLTEQQASIPVYPGDEIVKMDRIRRMIAEKMVLSKRISPHVTNFIEADVTNMVLWRNRIKESFEKREKQKITITPMFIEAAAQSLKEFPGVNASVDGDNIILRKDINISIAVALPSGNLIVPVIRNADQKSLLGLTNDLNTLANNARNNKLSPDDILGGTFTITNFGLFGNLTGTPIINQPQVAILGMGTIEKKPAVIETPTGDMIGIRHKIMLALTFDHRIIDGALGGAFLKSIAQKLENFDIDRTI